MSRQDMETWDGKHAASMPTPVIRPPPPPPVFAHVEHHFPKAGSGLDVACGRGEGAVWLAGRGLSCHGVDVSPVAIGMAQKLVDAYGLTERCGLDTWDLDQGLPPGPPVDVMLCHMFRDPRLYPAMIERLAPGGLLAIAVLSEVGAPPGRFSAPPGEVREVFGRLEVLDEGESDGVARILAMNLDR